MKNKTKFLLISALSLCTLSAGVTAVMASADDTQTQAVPTFTLKGTSILLKGEEAGIRFGVQMSVEDWNTYSEELAETWITISYEDTTSKDVFTSNAWYTVNDAGEYVEENFTAYQSTVVLYGVEEDFFATKFAIQAFASFKDTEKAEVVSKVFESKTMSEVAIEYATDADKLQAVDKYLPSYKVTVKVDGAELASETAKYGTPASALIEKLSAIPTPKKAGYVFAGWTVNGTAIEELAGATLTSDMEVEATWNAKANETLKAFDYDLSAEEALTFDVEGEIESVTVDGVDKTADVENGAIAYATASAYGTGVKAVRIETATKIYTGEMTIANYVISDTDSWKAWYGVIATTPRNAQQDLYVVVASDFTYTGTECTVHPSGDFKGTLNGTFDGRGHVITGMKIGNYTLFSSIDGTIKNIAFVDLTSNGSNAEHGLLARYSWGGTLENVYISGTATKGIKDIIGKNWGSEVTVKNCVFNVALSGTGNLFFNSGNGTQTFENVYAITTKTAIADGITDGIYDLATTEFVKAVKDNMQNTYFSVDGNVVYFNGTKIIAAVKPEGKVTADHAMDLTVSADGIISVRPKQGASFDNGINHYWSRTAVRIPMTDKAMEKLLAGGSVEFTVSVSDVKGSGTVQATLVSGYEANGEPIAFGAVQMPEANTPYTLVVEGTTEGTIPQGIIEDNGVYYLHMQVLAKNSAFGENTPVFMIEENTPRVKGDHLASLTVSEDGTIFVSPKQGASFDNGIKHYWSRTSVRIPVSAEIMEKLLAGGSVEFTVSVSNVGGSGTVQATLVSGYAANREPISFGAVQMPEANTPYTFVLEGTTDGTIPQGIIVDNGVYYLHMQVLAKNSTFGENTPVFTISKFTVAE